MEQQPYTTDGYNFWLAADCYIDAPLAVPCPFVLEKLRPKLDRRAAYLVFAGMFANPHNCIVLVMWSL